MAPKVDPLGAGVRWGRVCVCVCVYVVCVCEWCGGGGRGGLIFSLFFCFVVVVLFCFHFHFVWLVLFADKLSEEEVTLGFETSSSVSVASKTDLCQIMLHGGVSSCWILTPSLPQPVKFLG